MAGQDTTSVEVLFRLRVNVNDVDDDDSYFRTIEDSVIEGMTSTDMTDAIGQCLAGWYLNLRDDDVDVVGLDAIAVRPPSDKRRNRAFQVHRNGGLSQTD